VECTGVAEPRVIRDKFQEAVIDNVPVRYFSMVKGYWVKFCHSKSSTESAQKSGGRHRQRAGAISYDGKPGAGNRLPQ
jgi:hypothetical protein